MKCSSNKFSQSTAILLCCYILQPLEVLRFTCLYFCSESTKLNIQISIVKSSKIKPVNIARSATNLFTPNLKLYINMKKIQQDGKY